MLDALKAAGALAGIMKNKEALKAAGDRVKQRLADMRCAGSAGGGVVRVTVSGDMRVVEVHIEPAAVSAMGDPGHRALVQGFIAEATNDALDRAKQSAQYELQREAQAMGLGDLAGLSGLMK